MVVYACTPLCLHKLNQVDEQNCSPQSVVMVPGNPNKENQFETKDLQTVLVVMSGIGMAIGKRVVWSMTVNMYLQPRDSFGDQQGPPVSLRKASEV